MKLLIIDNKREEYTSLHKYLEDKGINLFRRESVAEGLRAVQDEIFDAIVCNVILPDGTIDDIIAGMQDHNKNAPVIVTAEFRYVPQAVAAVKKGAHNFIQKPFHEDDFYLKIEKAIEFKRLELEAQHLRGERPIIYKTQNFICESPKMQEVLELVDKVAPTDSTVMLVGETGTGKELVSGAIHYSSLRKDKAFVKVNCAALPRTLLESELFGHEKGDFTGADNIRIGRFEQADGGSILFDEITELDFQTQVKLLRVLQEQEFERVGGDRTIKVDVRIMSATNKDIKHEVEEGRFREDLYYRLNVIPIKIPPLRHRQEDILPLARHFLQQFSGEFGKEIRDFDEEVLNMLREHTWPGNVRELRNTIERAVLMCDGDVITSDELNLKGVSKKKEFAFMKIPKEGLSLAELEEDLIRQALRATNDVQKDAAKLLKMSPRKLNYKIQKYGISSAQWHKNK